MPHRETICQSIDGASSPYSSIFMTRGNYRGEDKAPGSPQHIEKFVSGLLTDFNLVVTGIAALPYELKRVDTDEIIKNVDQLSSGEAQLVTIGLDILTIASIWEVNGQTHRIILIDEPDAHIHPDLQVRFADFLFQIAEHFELQVVVATHSTSLLAAVGQFGGEKASVIARTQNIKLRILAQFRKSYLHALGDMY